MALVPFAVWLSDLPAGRAGRAAAVRGGAVLGGVYYLLLLHWMVLALGRMGVSALPVFAVVVLGLAGATALVVTVMHDAVRHRGVPLWLALPITWTGLEWTLEHLPGGLAYPWLGLGTSLTGFPRVVGIAELVGARGITFWIVLVNALVAVLLLEARTSASRRGREGDGRPRSRHAPGALPTPAGRWVAGLVATVLVVLVPMAWGILRAASLEIEAVGRVAVVQPNLRPGDVDPWAALDPLMGAVPPSAVDLVVLPEGVFDEGATENDLVRLQGHSREAGAPILFGAVGWSGPDAERATATSVQPRNSAFVMEPGGLTDFRYDKHHLVPIVERQPLARAGFGGRAAGLFFPGEAWSVAFVDEIGYGPLICYESTFASAARRQRLAGADVLVNLTNDGWFGRGRVLRHTTAIWQHPAHLVMRAIENRTAVVRAADTGISLVVDPVGRIREPTSTFEADLLVADVYSTFETTLFTRYGDVAGALSALLSAALALLMVVSPGARLDPPGPGH